MNITEDDLEQSHRLGKQAKKQNNSRPIIVKLVKCNLRRKIFYNKSKLKVKKISVTENLTKIRTEP